MDASAGRFADVGVERCRRCGQGWLVYSYEQEAFPESGRWFRGAVSPEQADRASVADALSILASLPWYLYGGSYFDSTGKRSDVTLNPRDV